MNLSTRIAIAGITLLSQLFCVVPGARSQVPDAPRISDDSATTGGRLGDVFDVSEEEKKAAKSKPSRYWVPSQMSDNSDGKQELLFDASRAEDRLAYVFEREVDAHWAGRRELDIRRGESWLDHAALFAEHQAELDGASPEPGHFGLELNSEPRDGVSQTFIQGSSLEPLITDRCSFVRNLAEMADGRTDRPTGVAWGANGEIMVVDSDVFRIQVFDTEGNFLRKFGAWGSGDGQFRLPMGVSVGPSGEIVVADSGNDRIQVFDMEGNFLRKFGAWGDGDGKLRRPEGVSVSSSGEIVVVDTGNDRIQVFDMEGNFLRKFGEEGEGDGQFFHPVGVSVSSSGEIVVADTGNDRIQVFDMEGNFLRKFGEGQPYWFDAPDAVSVSSSGEIVVAYSSTHRIQVFDMEGNSSASWGWGEGHYGGDGDGQLRWPSGVSVSSSGEIVVADRNNDRIQVFDMEGNFLRKFGELRSRDGQFDGPTGVSVSSGGEIVVADTRNDRIQVFDMEGNFLRSFGERGTGDGQLRRPEGVSVSPGGEIVVADTGNYRIQVFDMEGNFLRKFGEEATGDGQLGEPSGVSVSSSGEIMVADTGWQRIQVFDMEGNFLRSFGERGTGHAQFISPRGVSVSPSGEIVVADDFNDRVQVFDMDGNFLRRFGNFGDRDGKFRGPTGVSVSSGGEIVVADTWNNRIQVFDMEGNFLRSFGERGTGDGQLRAPSGVSVSASGEIVVTDRLNQRIAIWDCSGRVNIIDSVSPNPVTGSNSPQRFTIYGEDFDPSATVTLRDLRTGEIFPDREVISRSSGQLTINPVFTTAAAAWSVQVINPDGGSSNQFEFEVLDGGALWARVAGTGGSGLRLRNGADRDAEVIAVMPEGSELLVLDSEPVQADGHEWLRVHYRQHLGWAAKAFLWVSNEPSGSDTSPPLPEDFLGPEINQIQPKLVKGADFPRELIIHGRRFDPRASVTLRNLDTGEEFSERRIVGRSKPNRVTITHVFPTNSSTWSVQVLNPDGQFSEKKEFKVIAAGSEPLDPPVLLGPGSTRWAGVPTGKPTFRWKEVAGAERYTIQVRDLENDRIVLEESTLDATEFTLPQELTQGVYYKWKVRAHSSVADSPYSEEIEIVPGPPLQGDSHGLSEYDYHDFFWWIEKENRGVGLRNLDEELATYPEGDPLTKDDKNLIVLVHGWNRKGHENPFEEKEWAQLLKNLTERVDYRKTDWRIIRYLWPDDADTGKIGATGAGIASNRGYVHGLNLAKKILERVNTNQNNNLRNVHLIAHSAGTWMAYSASRVLVVESRANISVTLLDPFIPNDRFLESDLIRALPKMLGSDSVTDHYYADDFLTGLFTDETFGWELALQTDQNETPRGWPKDETIPEEHWDGHAGPVQFYADTIDKPNLVPAKGLGWIQSPYMRENHPSPETSISVTDLLLSFTSQGDVGNVLLGRDERIGWVLGEKVSHSLQEQGSKDGERLGVSSTLMASAQNDVDALIRTDLQVPVESEALVINYRFVEQGHGDRFVARVNGAEVWSQTAEEYEADSFDRTGPIDVSNLSGQTIELEIALHTGNGTGDSEVWVSGVTLLDQSELPALDNGFWIAAAGENGNVIKDPDEPSYLLGETVALTAIPDDGHYFAGWKGDRTNTSNPLAVEVNEDLLLRAVFLPKAKLDVGLISGGVVTLTISAEPGRTVNIETSTNLEQWTALESLEVDGSGSAEWEETTWEAERRFYRVRIEASASGGP